MIETIKSTGIIFLCALFLWGSVSCFDVVTGGNVDKEWPKNNAKNPRHSGTTTKTDTVYTDINDTIGVDKK